MTPPPITTTLALIGNFFFIFFNTYYNYYNINYENYYSNILFNMKNILVTGGAGYIGSAVSNLLIKKKIRVTIVDNLVTGNKKNLPKKANFIKCDISNKKRIKTLLKKENFSAVIHMAGLIRIDESIKNPAKYYTNNYHKTKIFLEICKENNLNNIIFSSTAAVYGNINKKLIDENCNLKPNNPYAKSKKKIEDLIVKMSFKSNFKYIILRYFNVAGEVKDLKKRYVPKTTTHLIKKVCELVSNKKKKLIINGNNYDTFDGTAIRDYIHISDLADMHYRSLNYLLREGNSEIFNCGYGVGYSVKQIIDTMSKIIKRDLKYKIGPRRKGDCACVISNPNKFKRKIKWEPKFNNLTYILKSALNNEKNL